MLPAVFGLLLGGVLGSFVMAAAGRISKKESLWNRSYCLNCKHQLRWYDLFPYLSYTFLLGRCRYCKVKIPPRDFLGEITLGVLVALLFVSLFPQDPTSLITNNLLLALFIAELVFKSFVLVVLALVFLVDLKTGLIHDRITYPATAVSVVYWLVVTVLSFIGPASGLGWWKALEPALLALLSAVVASSLFILLIVITRGKGMGWGDVKYVFVLGLFLGYPNTVVAIFLAFLSGAVFSLGLIATGKKGLGQTIPFGPFLSFGAYIALIWGKQLIDWYWSGLIPVI